MTHVNSFILSTLENGIQKVVLNKPAKKNALSFQVNKCKGYLISIPANENGFVSNPSSDLLNSFLSN